MTQLLETRNLKKTFGAVVAASNINITINQGEILGVIGSNGAGKTTFVNMVTGYLPPSGGEILFENKDITGIKSRDITRMGICRSFQIPQLFGELTVLDNILTALTIAQEQKPVLFRPAITAARTERAFQILQRFDITDYVLFPKFLPQDPAFFSQISVVRNFPLTMPIRQSQFRCKILTFPI